MIDFATSNKCDVIFITDDIKEDWWLRVNGKTIGPRPELRREFNEKSSQRFYMYNLAHWLELTRRKRGDVISSETVAEARAQQNREAEFTDSGAVRRREIFRRNHQLYELRKEIDRNIDNIRERYEEMSLRIRDLDDESIFASSKSDKDSKDRLSWIEKTRASMRHEMSDMYQTLLKLQDNRESIMKELQHINEIESLRLAPYIEKM